MRKLFIVVAVLVWGGLFSGSALAQSGQYAGASIGAPILQGYYGLEDVLAPDVDARIRLALGIFGGFGISVGADALFDLSTLDDAGLLQAYAGVGPSLGFAGSSYSSLGSSYGYSVFNIDVTGLGGVKYALDPNINLFGEVGLGLGFAAVTARAAGFPTTATAGGLYVPFRLGLGATFRIQ
jgi:hypothetical protein